MKDIPCLSYSNMRGNLLERQWLATAPGYLRGCFRGGKSGLHSAGSPGARKLSRMLRTRFRGKESATENKPPWI